jgi:hypothetical protein
LEKRSVRAFGGKQIDADFHTEGFGGETNGPAWSIRATLPLIAAAQREVKNKTEGKRHVLQGMGAFLVVQCRPSRLRASIREVIKKEIDLLIVGRTPAARTMDEAELAFSAKSRKWFVRQLAIGLLVY